MVVGLAACSLITSLDGLTGGLAGAGGDAGTMAQLDGAPSASADGGGSRVDASGPTGDAGEEAGPALEDSGSGGTDDGAVADARSDASDGGQHDAAVSPFCASQTPTPLFCDDFDEGALATPWDQLPTTSGAATLDANGFVSAPYAMLASVNPNASVSQIDVAGYKSFPAKQGATGKATFSFDIRIDAADTSSASDAILSAIQLWNGSAYWDLELEVFYASATGDFAVDLSEDGNGSGTTYVPHAVTSHLAMGTWTRVTLTVALPAGTGGATPATLAFDGTVVATDTVHVTTSNPIPEILLGTTYATPTASGWAVRYDNVTFDEP